MILWTNKICKYALNTPLLGYIFVKRNVCKNGRGFCAFSSAITLRLFLRSYIFVKRNVHKKRCDCCAFSSAITLRLFLRSYIFVKRNVHKKRRDCCACSSAITGGTGEFMYKASILDNKLLLSNMTNHEAT